MRKWIGLGGIILFIAFFVTACGGGRVSSPQAALSLEEAAEQVFERWAQANGEPYHEVKLTVVDVAGRDPFLLPINKMS